MQNLSSPHVWALPCSERTAVAEAIVRVLTEEVENERFRKTPRSCARLEVTVSRRRPRRFALRQLSRSF